MLSLFNLVVIVFFLLLVPTAYAGMIGAPYAPTFARAYRKAFDYIKLGSDDLVVDIGSGDGKVLLEANRRGAKAVGYELSPIFWGISTIRSLGKPRIKNKLTNFYKTPLPQDTTVVFAFLMPDHMEKTRAYVAKQNLPKAKYFLAYSFPLAESIKPLHIVNEPKTGKLYIYTMSDLRNG